MIPFPGRELKKILGKLGRLAVLLPPEHLPYLVALKELKKLNDMANQVVLMVPWLYIGIHDMFKPKLL